MIHLETTALSAILRLARLRTACLRAAGLRATGGSLLSVLLICAAVAQAESYDHFDPRGHTSLDQVIALCATEPGSRRFDQAWLNWLAENPDADISQAVDTVISRAGTFRSMAIPGMTPTPRGEKPDPGAIADRMLSLAGKPRAR